MEYHYGRTASRGYRHTFLRLDPLESLQLFRGLQAALGHPMHRRTAHILRPTQLYLQPRQGKSIRHEIRRKDVKPTSVPQKMTQLPGIRNCMPWSNLSPLRVLLTRDLKSPHRRGGWLVDFWPEEEIQGLRVSIRIDTIILMPRLDLGGFRFQEHEQYH